MTAIYAPTAFASNLRTPALQNACQWRAIHKRGAAATGSAKVESTSRIGMRRRTPVIRRPAARGSPNRARKTSNGPHLTPVRISCTKKMPARRSETQTDDAFSATPVSFASTFRNEGTTLIPSMANTTCQRMRGQRLLGHWTPSWASHWVSDWTPPWTPDWTLHWKLHWTHLEEEIVSEDETRRVCPQR